MRKLVVDTFVSMDGVMQAPGGPDEDRDGGFEHGGWTVPYWDEQMMQFMADSTAKAGALLLGRKTYDIFAASWPLLGDDDPFAAILNHIPKHVVSRTLTDADLTWNNSSLLTGDLAGAVRALKEQDGGELQVPGSSALIQDLLAHDLIDEYRLLIFPVLLGSGKRLFGTGTTPGGLRLTSTSTSSTGVTINTYERGGDLTYGALGPEIDIDEWNRFSTGTE
jgi:dihydrofolate reductase